MRENAPWRIVAALVLVAFVAVTAAFSPEPTDTTPENNAYLPKVTWEGYGVDWMLRSLRIGTPFADSLMADGWLGAYGIDVDTLKAATMSVDTLEVMRTAFAMSYPALTDTLVTGSGDSIFVHCGLITGYVPH